MGIKLLFFGLMSLIIMSTPATASAASPCCEDKACCQKSAACCQPDTDLDTVGVFFGMTRPEEPVRQTSVVWFQRPVKIGDRILLGKYVIEHDNDRMAKGRPCTHIYAADDLQLPVVAFHCTHLNRDVADHPLVVLKSLGDPSGMTELVEFQFAGEKSAHGVPSIR